MRSAPRSEKLRPDRHRLHPLFDGYAAAENRGTLALAYALNPAHSPGLLSSFSHAFLEGLFPVRRGDRVEARLQLNSIDLSIRAEDLLQRSNGGKVLRDALRGLACDANTKSLLVEYRHYFLDAKLQKQLRAREFADRLLHSAKHLLDLYRWFGRTSRRRLG